MNKYGGGEEMMKFKYNGNEYNTKTSELVFCYHERKRPGILFSALRHIYQTQKGEYFLVSKDEAFILKKHEFEEIQRVHKNLISAPDIDKEPYKKNI